MSLLQPVNARLNAVNDQIVGRLGLLHLFLHLAEYAGRLGQRGGYWYVVLGNRLSSVKYVLVSPTLCGYVPRVYYGKYVPSVPAFLNWQAGVQGPMALSKDTISHISLC